MRHLALLVSILALAGALVLPGSLLAQESEEPAPPGPAATDPAQADATPSQPAPLAQPAPAPAGPEPAAAEPVPPPEPQVLADERKQKREPKAVAAASGSVTIVDFSFSPGTITVNVGDTVTWANDGPTPHSATSSSGGFDTGIFPAGQSRSHTFDQAGTFSYICTPHPNMRGTVVVQGAQTGGGGGGETTDSGAGAADTGTTGEAAQSDVGPALPNSGADSGALFILGGLLLLLGVAVHRRVRPE